MTALPTLKLRVLPTFPSAVLGSGPITITKVAGVFTIGFDVSIFGVTTPPAGNYPTDYIIIYDSIALSSSRVALSSLGLGGARSQRSVTVSPIVATSSDQIINFNINAGSPTCVLPLAATRNGMPLTLKDAGGHAAAHNLTITFTGGELVDGQSQIVMSGNFSEITLRPFNDGTNTGWSVI